MDQTGSSPLLPDQQTVDQIVQRQAREKFIREQRDEAIKKMIPGEVVDKFAYLKDFTIVWNDEEKMQFNDRMERTVEDKFPEGEISGDLSDAVFEKGSIGTDKLGSLSSDKIKQAVSYAAGVTSITESSQTINNGNWGGIVTAITDEDDPQRILFGYVEATAYKDSVADSNRIPQGSSTIGSQHEMIEYFDLHYNTVLLPRPGKDLGYTMLVQNNTGGNNTYYFRHRWRYLGNQVD